MSKNDTENVQVDDNEKVGLKSKMKSFKLSKKSKEVDTDIDDNARKFNPKMVVAIAIGIVALAIIIFIFVTILSVPKGMKIFNKTPLGRNIEYIENETDNHFLSMSRASNLSKVCAFDYICESDKLISVEGVNLPEWAVLLRKGSDNTITKATYYNFNQIKHGYKGNKMNDDFNTDVIKYGMKISEVDKTLGIEPYTIYKEIDNKLTYVYRCHYNDKSTSDDVVINCYVVFDEVDETVKNVYSTQIDIVSNLLKVN